jgi:hypothetical protein
MCASRLDVRSSTLALSCLLVSESFTSREASSACAAAMSDSLRARARASVHGCALGRLCRHECVRACGHTTKCACFLCTYLSICFCSCSSIAFCSASDKHPSRPRSISPAAACACASPESLRAIAPPSAGSLSPFARRGCDTGFLAAPSSAGRRISLIGAVVRRARARRLPFQIPCSSI